MRLSCAGDLNPERGRFCSRHSAHCMFTARCRLHRRSSKSLFCTRQMAESKVFGVCTAFKDFLYRLSTAKDVPSAALSKLTDFTRFNSLGSLKS